LEFIRFNREHSLRMLLVSQLLSKTVRVHSFCLPSPCSWRNSSMRCRNRNCAMTCRRCASVTGWRRFSKPF